MPLAKDPSLALKHPWVKGEQAGYGVGTDISFIKQLENKQGGEGWDVVSSVLIPMLHTVYTAAGGGLL